jgi:5-methylcytosine-specific restriction protein A
MRPCLECPAPATHRHRCKAHYDAYNNRSDVRAQRKRRAVIAAGHDAAAQMRKDLRAAGYTNCARCKFEFLASALDVDHVIPLYQGGTDTADNLQALCKVCHKIKTNEDKGCQTAPF